MEATFHTGDISKDFFLNNIFLRNIRYNDVKTLWSGCIDAPSYLPSGSSFYSKETGEVYTTVSDR